MQAIHDLAARIARHQHTDGMQQTAVPGMWLIRSAQPTRPLQVLHVPAVCIIAQGAKVVTLGGDDYRYDPAKYLVVSVDLPLTGSVTEASPEEPYLCLRVDLDPQLLAAIDLELPPSPGKPVRGAAARGLYLSQTTPAMVDVGARLVRLLEAPQDIAILAPLLIRELHYRLLTGEHAGVVRHIACGEGRMAQITRAICWIKSNYNRPLSVERLAGEVGMSASTLHEHFKAVTAMSPLQYQKQLRLQEARRLMLTGLKDAARAGHAVGYESSSQFSREYARFFGMSPGRDSMRLREAMLDGGPSVLQGMP
ncbi:AraC family transcriptional regulator [Massilia sp.]|uniref:AraC family transcriptional regulator n=1 Tax=Massilia sp. TaxID=1882437 RepID=UPI00289A1D86|nr:AraC family transcriptional regulator [Massilia sp.]